MGDTDGPEGNIVKNVTAKAHFRCVVGKERVRESEGVDLLASGSEDKLCLVFAGLVVFADDCNRACGASETGQLKRWKDKNTIVK